MSDWVPFAAEPARRGQSGVLVTVATTRGSVPRDPGTRMIVFADDALGTIGGGHLEHRAIGIARTVLRGERPESGRLERFALGPSLGQCCGGVVELLFERLPAASCGWVHTLEARLAANRPVIMVTEVQPAQGDDARGDEVEDEDAGNRVAAGVNRLLVCERECVGELSDARRRESAIERAREMLTTGDDATVRLDELLLYERIRPGDFHVVLFGAGHVGRAVVNVLGALPCRVTWVDPRAEEFPAHPPANVRVEIGEQPEFEVDAAPPGSHVLITTHSHALDQTICERALRRDDLAWCGLIGSWSKRRRFEQRMRARGLSSEALARLTCPIGIDGISGKHPGEIAVAVCAQILCVRERRAARIETVQLADEAVSAREARARPWRSVKDGMTDGSGGDGMRDGSVAWR